jgi:hypothetical protein
MNIYPSIFAASSVSRRSDGAAKREKFGAVVSLFRQPARPRGQHHALEMALTMLDRARWTGKLEEAEIYRRWLVGKLNQPLGDNAKPMQARVESRKLKTKNLRESS